jgi:hypothetical protein
MFPRLVTVRHRRPDGRWLRLHVPVLPVLLVASPLLLLAVLAGLVACLVTGGEPGGRAAQHRATAVGAARHADRDPGGPDGSADRRPVSQTEEQQ